MYWSHDWLSVDLTLNLLLRSAVGMTHSLRSYLWWTIPFRILLGHFGIPIGSLTIKSALARHTYANQYWHLSYPTPQVYMGCALAILFQVHSSTFPILGPLSRVLFGESLVNRLRSAVGMTHSLRSDLWWTIPFRILLGHYTQKSTKPILALKLSVSAIITPGGLPQSAWLSGYNPCCTNRFMNRDALPNPYTCIYFLRMFGLCVTALKRHNQSHAR